MSPKINMHRKLPDAQLYACSKRDAKSGLAALEGTEVHFGLTSHFEFDSRCTKRPELSGDVVASVTIDRERATNVHFYPVTAADFSEREARLFADAQLPAIAAWAVEALGLPETQITGHRQLIIESVVDGFRRHEVSFL